MSSYLPEIADYSHFWKIMEIPVLNNWQLKEEENKLLLRLKVSKPRITRGSSGAISFINLLRLFIVYRCSGTLLWIQGNAVTSKMLLMSQHKLPNVRRGFPLTRWNVNKEDKLRHFRQQYLYNDLGIISKALHV